MKKVFLAVAALLAAAIGLLAYSENSGLGNLERRPSRSERPPRPEGAPSRELSIERRAPAPVQVEQAEVVPNMAPQLPDDRMVRPRVDHSAQWKVPSPRDNEQPGGRDPMNRPDRPGRPDRPDRPDRPPRFGGRYPGLGPERRFGPPGEMNNSPSQRQPPPRPGRPLDAPLPGLEDGMDE